MAYAVIQTGGKQYKVSEGDRIRVEKLPGEHKEGEKIVFDQVLAKDDGKEITVGTPVIAGAKVEAEFVEEGRDKKIPVIRFKSKSRYFKNKGHRQPYTSVVIKKI